MKPNRTMVNRSVKYKRQMLFKVDGTSFYCVESLATSERVTLNIHESRARFEKKNNMAVQCEAAFLQFMKKNSRSTEVVSTKTF